MNHDPPSSSAARAQDPTSDNSDATPANDDTSQQNGGSQASAAGLHPQRRRKQKKKDKKRDPGLRKKFQFVTHLLKGLDTFLLAELSALYYMECSVFRLLIRAGTHALFVSPKDEQFPFLMLINRMHVVMILLPNAYCIIYHLFGALPEAHDYNRGYQHGGILVDFIGQKPPQYRLYYLLADILVLFLQLLMLTIHDEREKMRVKLGLFRPITPAAGQEAPQEGRTLEDLDREERGVNETNDIELQPLTEDIDGEPPRGLNDDDDGSSSQDNSDEGSTRSHLSDMLDSGNSIVGEYHIIHSIRSATSDIQSTAARSLQSLSYSATLAALEARRRGVSAATQTAQ